MASWRAAMAVLLVVGAAWPPAAAGGSVPSSADRNGDGEVVIACLGDSNTASKWQIRKPGGFESDQGWCEQLERLLGDPHARVVNMGAGGATIGANELDDVVEERVFFEGSHQLDYVLASQPVDVVLLAFGTNDVPPAHQRTPFEIADLYNRLVRRVRSKGLLAMVALTPVVYRHVGTGEFRRSPDAIEETNAALRATFAPRTLLDFHSGASRSEHLDDLHLNAEGQARRAEEARRGLIALAERSPPPIGVRSLRWSAGHWGPASPRLADDTTGDATGDD